MTLVGVQMRYAVHDRNGWPLSMLGFCTAACALAPRDRYIGWTPTLRKKEVAARHCQSPVPPRASGPHPQPWILHPRSPVQETPHDWTAGSNPRRNHTGSQPLRHRQAVWHAHKDVWLRPLAKH